MIIKKYFIKILPFLQRGLSVAAACQQAGVPQQTVSDYIKKDKKLSVEIEKAKRTIEITARENIAQAIKAGSIENAKWYLERKCKEEFSIRTEHLNENHENEMVLLEIPKNGREADFK